MGWTKISLLATALTAGCAQSPETQPVREISFSATGCFGPCPVFDFTIEASGKGTYEGEAYVAVRDEREFTATREQFQALVERLAPFRPRGEVTYDQSCDGPWATDNPSVRIAWYDNEKVDILNWYLGCEQPGLVEHTAEIYEAWRELPLDDLVGTADNRFTYQDAEN